MVPKIVCRVCSSEVQPADKFCSSCGAKLEWQDAPSPPTGAGSGQTMSKPGKAAAVDRRALPLKGLQSWKLTVGVGVVLVAVLVYTKTSRNVDTPGPNPAAPPASGAMAQQIAALEKTVNANPEDQQAVLHLANALHDAKAFPRAITKYKRYLDLNPSDADARVDLGIVCLHTGDVVKASEWFRRCAEIDSSSETGKKAKMLISKHTFNQPS